MFTTTREHPQRKEHHRSHTHTHAHTQNRGRMQPSSLTFSEILQLRGGRTRGESDEDDVHESFIGVVVGGLSPTTTSMTAAPTVDSVGFVQQGGILPHNDDNRSTRSESSSFALIKGITEREDEAEWNTNGPLRSSLPKSAEVGPPFVDDGDFNNNDAPSSSLSDTLESLLCSAEWGTSSSCDATIDDQFNSNVGLVVAGQCCVENKNDCDSSDLGVLLAAMGMAAATPPATTAKKTGHAPRPPTRHGDEVRYAVEELMPADADEGLSIRQNNDDDNDAVCKTGDAKTVAFDANVNRGETGGAYLPFSSDEGQQRVPSSSSLPADSSTKSSSPSTPSSSPRSGESSGSSCSSSSSSESDEDEPAATTLKEAQLRNNTCSAPPLSTRPSLSLFSTHVAKCATRMKALATAREVIINKAVETALLELGVGSILLSTMRTQTQEPFGISDLSALLGSKRLRTAKLRPHHVALAHRCWQEKRSVGQRRGLAHTVRNLLQQAGVSNGSSSPSQAEDTTTGASLTPSASTSAPRRTMMTLHSWTVAVLKLMVDTLVVSLISPFSTAAERNNSNKTTEEVSASDKRAEVVLSRLQSTLNSWAGGDDSDDGEDDDSDDFKGSKGSTIPVSSARANDNNQNMTLSDRYRDLVEGERVARFGNNNNKNDRKTSAGEDDRRFNLSHLTSAAKVMREDTTSSSSSSSSSSEDDDEAQGHATTTAQSYNPLSIDNDGLGLMGMAAGGRSRKKANLLSTRRLVPFIMGCSTLPPVERANAKDGVYASKGNALAKATSVCGAHEDRGSNRSSSGFEWMWDVSAYTSEEVAALVRKLMASSSRGQQQGQGLGNTIGAFSASSPSSSPLQMLSRANKWFTSQPKSMARVAGHVLRALLSDGTDELKDSVRRLRKKTREHEKNKRANNKAPTSPTEGACLAKGVFVVDSGYTGRHTRAASLEEMAAKSVSLPSLAGGHQHVHEHVRGLAALAMKGIERAREPQTPLLDLAGSSRAEKRPRDDEAGGNYHEESGTRTDARLTDGGIAISSNIVREGGQRTAAIPSQHLRNAGSLAYTGHLCCDGLHDGLPASSVRLWGAEGAVVPLTLLLPESQ